jgi:hypothetical protein
MTQSAYSKDTLSAILIDKITAPAPQDTVQIQKNKIVFGSDGSYTDVTNSTPLPVALSGPFVPPAGADRVIANYPDDTTEVYQYQAGSTLLATVTVTYTDSLKTNISSVIQT